ncbi:hypothetical protein [Sphingomonas aquatilis]|uniref:hypothetical protein n=1 Tax=Sphingomonas aquatilis TaxID=93063 RepID=UPI0023F7351D|nr:hypothetical protein [Sphingomonas aquatilis]MCI4654675.1 hypothetical protein [Sphingomonas aquatilis]
MNHAKTDDIAQRITAAARHLVEGGMADASAGRFSRTLFAAGRGSGDELERITFDAARNNGLGVVSLRLDRENGAMPRRVNLAFDNAGERSTVRDCVLWAEEEGPILIVPFDAREQRHFAIGPDGLEERRGRPAAMLGRGMSLAKARLGREVRTARQERRRSR